MVEVGTEGDAGVVVPAPEAEATDDDDDDGVPPPTPPLMVTST